MREGIKGGDVFTLRNLPPRCGTMIEIEGKGRASLGAHYQKEPIFQQNWPQSVGRSTFSSLRERVVGKVEIIAKSESGPGHLKADDVLDGKYMCLTR